MVKKRDRKMQTKKDLKGQEEEGKSLAGVLTEKKNFLAGQEW